MSFDVEALEVEGAQAAEVTQSSERGLRVRLLEERDTEVVRDIIKQHHATAAHRDAYFILVYNQSDDVKYIPNFQRIHLI